MDDIIRKHMEMTSDIIQLKESNLFKDSEISNILQQRRRFNYKVNNITKQVQDVRAAIRYENMLLLELMKRRRIKNKPMKMQNVDFLIVKRIQSLYNTAMVDFPNEYELHLDYYEFLKQHQGFNTAVNEHFRKMIEKFENNPQVFKVAASKTKNNKEAIEILLKGLSQHPQLYTDLIEHELKEPDEHRLKDKLLKYIDDILKTVPSHVLLIEILKLLESYSNLLPIQNYIIGNLLEKYWFEEEVWHNIALRELNGIYYKAPLEEEQNKTNRKSIKRCVARYRDGISRLPPKKQPALWKLYLHTVIELQKENPNVALIFRNNILKQALDDAKRANIQIDEEYWNAWIDSCGSNDEFLVEKLNEATSEQPQSVMLWTIYLKHYIVRDSPLRAKHIFKEAVKSLGATAAVIWDMYIDYHLLGASLSDVNDLYKEAVSVPYEEISRIFKPRYLTWTVLSYNITEARKVYWEMASRPPYCRELHEEMLQIEMMDVDHNSIENQLKVIAIYARQLGHMDVDLWIQWISLIREQRSFNQHEKEQEIFEHAVTRLPDRLATEFEEKYKELSRIS